MATVTFDHVFKRFPATWSPSMTSTCSRRRRVPRPRRPVRLRQDDRAAHDRRARDDQRREALDRRPGRERRRPQGPRHRDGLPELRALPAHERLRQHGLRAEAAEDAARTRSTRGCARPPSILGLSSYLDRKPKALSGGQRQRVALGRAIVREPKVFLMDEPLSNLDAKLRVQTRAEIARIHRRLGTTIVYVTHDQVEAMTMGDRIAVMKRRHPPAGRHARRSSTSTRPTCSWPASSAHRR